MQFLTDVFLVFPLWIEALIVLVGGFAAVAALTPTKKDDAVASKLMAGLQKLKELFVKPKE